MTLDYVLLANHAEPLLDGLVNLLGGGVRVYDKELPYMVPVFYMVARAIFTHEERGKVFPYRMEIRDPQGNLIPAAQAEDVCIPTQSPYPDLPDSVGITIAVQRFTFFEAGLYKLIFRLAIDPIELPILAHQKRTE